MKKVAIKVVKEVKVDGRKNNTGRPVNKKSARQVRLAKQAFYSNVNAKFKKGNQFIIHNTAYKYNSEHNCISSVLGNHVCNVSYIGRTKVQGFTYVLGKKVNVELNLKTLKFVS